MPLVLDYFLSRYNCVIWVINRSNSKVSSTNNEYQRTQHCSCKESLAGINYLLLPIHQLQMFTPYNISTIIFSTTYISPYLFIYLFFLFFIIYYIIINSRCTDQRALMNLAKVRDGYFVTTLLQKPKLSIFLRLAYQLQYNITIQSQ